MTRQADPEVLPDQMVALSAATITGTPATQYVPGGCRQAPCWLTRNPRARKRRQNEQLGTEPDVLKVLVVTPVPEGVMFELSRKTVAFSSPD